MIRVELTVAEIFVPLVTPRLTTGVVLNGTENELVESAPAVSVTVPCCIRKVPGLEFHVIALFVVLSAVTVKTKFEEVMADSVNGVLFVLEDLTVTNGT